VLGRLAGFGVRHAQRAEHRALGVTGQIDPDDESPEPARPSEPAR